MIKTTHNILACIILLCAPALAAQGESSLTLPTPRDHYKTYDVQRARLELMGVSEIRMRVADFRSGAEVADSTQLKTEDVVQLARAAGLVKYKADILEIVLHSSNVLAVVPKESFDTYGPIIHDGLLAFLDGLPDERILDRALALAMSQDASRGEKSLPNG